MKQEFIVLILVLSLHGVISPAFALEDEEDRSGKHYVVNISLYYPISLNQSEYDSVNFNLSFVKKDLRGIQLCGLMWR